MGIISMPGRRSRPMLVKAEEKLGELFGFNVGGTDEVIGVMLTDGGI